MKHVAPYLVFDGEAEAAFQFYASVFGGEAQLVRFSDLGMNGAEENRVAHADLALGDRMTLMGSDSSPEHGPPLVRGNDVHVMIEPDDAAAAQRIFDALADGGSVQMDLQPTAWAERHGTCTDAYGVCWMINYTGSVHFGAGS